MAFIMVAETDSVLAQKISIYFRSFGHEVLTMERLREFSPYHWRIQVVFLGEEFWEQERLCDKTIFDVLDDLSRERLIGNLKIIFRSSDPRSRVPKSVQERTKLIWRPPYDLGELNKLLLAPP